MTTQVYADIKKSSEYHGQNRARKPFAVQFASDGATGKHVVLGLANRYRISDLNFFVLIDDKFIPLNQRL